MFKLHCIIQCPTCVGVKQGHLHKHVCLHNFAHTGTCIYVVVHTWDAVYVIYSCSHIPNVSSVQAVVGVPVYVPEWGSLRCACM